MQPEKFRESVQTRRRRAGHSQDALADALGIHPKVLSRKLNGSENAYLTHNEVKGIVKALAEWDAITTQAEAIALLGFMDMQPTSFTANEWRTIPLNRLAVEPVAATVTAKESRSDPNRSQAPTRAIHRAALPSPLTSLIGREESSNQVRSLLLRSDVRLVTLVGPGGIGKTRLALHVAETVQADFPDGVVFVALDTITDPALVVLAIGQALGVAEMPQMAPQDAILKALHHKKVLLVLDNFEHVLDAVQDVTLLLTHTPDLKIMVTSRSVLQAYGEHRFTVPPLDTPHNKIPSNSTVISMYSAVRLFVARAQSVLPDFALTDTNAPAIAAICHSVAGLPLAIELAAARIPVLTPDALRDQMAVAHLAVLSRGPRTMPARHRTLRGVIDWSYALLDVDEQLLLARLSIFSGGWTLEAALSVCTSAGIQATAVLDLLASLVDKSLIQHNAAARNAGRFAFLVAVHEYARERLIERREEDVLRHRHAAYYLNFLAEAAPHLADATQALWLDRIEDEHDNLRSAIREALEHDEIDTALRICAVLGRFWFVRGYFSEGLRWLDAVMAQPNLHANSTTQNIHLQVLHHASSLAEKRGDYGRARTLAQSMLDSAQAINATQESVTALLTLGRLAYLRGDYADASALTTQALTLSRSLNSTRDSADALVTLGWIANMQGDYGRAATQVEEALTLFRALDDTRSIAHTLVTLGWGAIRTEDYMRATTMIEDALTIFRALNDTSSVAHSYLSLGWVAALQKRYTHATQLLNNALTTARAIEDGSAGAHALSNLGWVAIMQQDSYQARRYHTEALALFQAMGDTSSMVECIDGLGIAFAAQGHADKAVRLWACAAHLRHTMGVPMLPELLPLYNQYLGITRNALNAEHWAEAWADGYAFSIEHAVIYALSKNDSSVPDSQYHSVPALTLPLS